MIILIYELSQLPKMQSNNWLLTWWAYSTEQSSTFDDTKSVKVALNCHKAF